jgi:ubiquinone/menaquinone biosynthesis C-methylase UbiE
VPLTAEEWHEQFLRQARWTREMRSHLYRLAGLRRACEVLDVGCGTGAITEELARRTSGQVIGLDLDPAMIGFASRSASEVRWLVGDAHRLPLMDSSIDLVLCNFLLLWTVDPGVVVKEMARVVRGGGVVLATTEPDYGGRIDYPEDIVLGPLMEDSLRLEGAHPRIGRRLKGLFSAAGLESESGVIASMWDDQQLAQEFDAEWQFILETLSNVASEKELLTYREKAREALRRGSRVVFMPNFWALGRKPAAA